MNTNLQSPETSRNLAARLLSGLWFGVFGAAASLVLRLIFVGNSTSGMFGHPPFNSLIWAVITPTLISAFWGAVWGKKIIGERFSPSGRAVGFGIVTAGCAFAVEVFLLAVTWKYYAQFYSYDYWLTPRSLISNLIRLFLFGSMIFGWALLILGGIAGYYVYKLAHHTPKAFRTQP